jgi:hypothetical protein
MALYSLGPVKGLCVGRRSIAPTRRQVNAIIILGTGCHGHANLPKLVGALGFDARVPVQALREDRQYQGRQERQRSDDDQKLG